jgi:hypothetical protein
MMSKVRMAAELLIEHGKALGAAAQAASFEGALTRLWADPSSLESAVGGALKDVQQQRQALEKHAAWARQQAEALLRDVEHPGAALARRLLVTYHAARAGWRGSR